MAPPVTRIAPAAAVGVPTMTDNLAIPNNTIHNKVGRNGHGIRRIY